MKRLELFFVFIQVPVDYLALLAAGVSAFALRYTNLVVSVRPVLFRLSWSSYWPLVFFVSAGWLVIFALSGLYSTNPNRKFSRDVTRIIMACSTGFAAITIYVFFTLQKFDSRFLVLAGWLIAMVYVIVGRLLLLGIKSMMHRAGYGLRRVVVIGNGNLTQTLTDTLGQERRFGMHIVKTFDNFSAGVANELATLNPDELIFTNPKAHESEALAAIDWANQHHVTFKYTADFFATVSSKMTYHTVAGIPLVELNRTPLIGWGRIFKRLFDIFFGTICLVLLSPFYALFALCIGIETGLPILYKNERVGQFGKHFWTLKFRTMRKEDSTGPGYGGDRALAREQELIKTSNAKTGPIYKVKDDPRITPLGKWLRRWSIDEIPQFWNVLKGDMSLVGPRPHQPREVAGYGPMHSLVFAIKPGITGLAQISGRSDLTFEDEMRLDAFYIEHWSLYMDLIILLKTPFVVLARRGSIV